MNVLLRCIVTATLCLSAGCETYRQDYSYDPAPSVSAQAPPRVMATVYGVLRGDSDNPAGVDLRVRLEAGDETAEMVRDDLSLVTADLVPLELVSVGPEGGMVAPARGAGTWRLVYAFPPGRDIGSLDLSGLVFTWRFRVGGMAQAGTVSFVKIVDPIWINPYSGPWWHGPWGYGRGGWYYY